MFNAHVVQAAIEKSGITKEELCALWWATQQALRDVGQVFVWDDVRSPATMIRPAAGGGAAATDAIYRGIPVIAFASNPAQRAFFTAQLPHGYFEGENVKPHIHWIIPSNPGADINVKWDIEMQWINRDTAVVASPDISVTTTKDITGLENILMKLDIGILDGTDKIMSSFLTGYIERDTTVANDYAGIVYLAELDFHVKFDTTGSQQEIIK